MNEDKELIERVSREPERRVFTINVGNMSTKEAELLVKQLRMKFKQQKDSQEDSNDR